MNSEIIKKIENILAQAGIEEYKQEAKIIIQALSNLTIEEIYLNKPILNEDEIIKTAKLRADTKKPIQYILNQGYFMGERYILNDSVLIPRDETEILVRHAYNLVKNKKEKINILDIGTGSGCISCALAKKLNNKDIEILATDISLDALEVAIENINKLNLVRKIIVRKSDIYSKIRDCEKFDLIVSNPPYIPLNMKKHLQKELEFEPQCALFADDEEGVKYYKKIIEGAKKYLKKDGYIAFELGINQSAIVKDMLKHDFCEIEIIKDLALIDRVISAKICA